MTHGCLMPRINKLSDHIPLVVIVMTLGRVTLLATQ